jgi:uncharacterized protein YjdB
MILLRRRTVVRLAKIHPRTKLATSLVIAACGGGEGGTPPDTTPRVTSVSVSPATATMVVDDQQQFTATVNVVNGASTAVAWTSSNATIASVSTSGQVQALAVGSATITATSSFDATKSAAASITVNPKPAVVSVAITPATPTIIVGQNVPLTATVSVVGGASTAVTWSSSQASIASVTSAGVLTGVAVGSASITATSVADPTKSATVPVVVNAPPPAVVSITVTPANPTAVVGDQVQLAAAVNVVSGAPTTVTWSSGDAAIATVSQTGQVTAVAPGAVTITATSTFDATKSGSTRLTVNPKPAVLSVIVFSQHAALIAGTTSQFTANVSIVGGASTAVTWATSAPGVATVDATGLVTAVAPGNVNISATSTFDATKSASAAIRVDAAAIVNSVTVTPGTLQVAVAATGQLNAAVSVGNNASQAVNWTSGNVATASVDPSGKVTGVAAGTVNIRATSQADATKFAESVVTVTAAPAFPSTASVVASTSAAFEPQEVEIARNGTVTWTFQSLTHNVTFDGATGAPNNIGSSANTDVSRAFSTAGTFNYQCTLHGGMTGRVIVR